MAVSGGGTDGASDPSRMALLPEKTADSNAIALTLRSRGLDAVAIRRRPCPMVGLAARWAAENMCLVNGIVPAVTVAVREEPSCWGAAYFGVQKDVRGKIQPRD